MQCSQCQAENGTDVRFCESCGAQLERRCVHCGHELSAQAKFCGQCGTSIAFRPDAEHQSRSAAFNLVPASTAEAQQEPPDGERKTVTALFADIKGSMELLEDLDPEEARAIVDPVLTLMMDAVHHYDGYVAQSTGDGIFALFGAPAAHEDHAQRALYAALRMQEELKRYSDRIRAEGRMPVQVRVGVNTGEVVVRSIHTGHAHTEYTPIGHATSLAARMQALAPIGSIATTAAVRKLCDGYFVFKDLGPTRVKGVSEPINVFEVGGLGALRTRLQRSAGRGLTKFVGRQREMDAIEHAAEQAKIGRGQIVAAIAEAGIGKSRLFYEFKVRNQAGWMVLEAFSVSHGKASAYLPVIDVMHAYFRISPDDDARTRREKVAGRLLLLDPALDEIRPYVFALLGLVEGEDPLAQMDTQIRRRRTQGAIKRILLRESLNQPLLVVFEDLHWIDEETQKLLNLLADSIGTARLLLLVNYRPEYAHAWGNKTYYTQLRLDPLGRESAEEMLGTLLGEGTDLVQIKRLMAEKTEGNPFFMEEIVQALFEEGILRRNGEIVLTQPLDHIRIPATVQAILAARIDRLPKEQKELLQTVAVIGREFSLSLVRAITSHAPDTLDRMLNHLQLAEFIYEQPAVGDTEYVFKHALTLEVAYNSVLIERRKVLHERVASAIESLHANTLDEHLDQLARHYSRCANTAKAIEYLRRAGEQAVGRSAYTEAEERAAAGLALFNQAGSEGHGPDELALQFILARALGATRGMGSPEAEEAFARCLELAERLDDRPMLFSALTMLRVARMFALQLHESRRLAERMVTLAHEADNPDMLASAYFAVANASLAVGELIGAREALEQTLTFCDRVGGRSRFHVMIDIKPACRGILGICLWHLGFPDRALGLTQEAWSLIHQSAPFGVAVACRAIAWTYLAVGDFDRALTAAERALRLSDEHGFSAEYALAMMMRAEVLTAMGRVGEGAAEARRAFSIVRSSGVAVSPRFVLLHLAEVEIRAGHIEEALATLDQGLTMSREIGAQLDESAFLHLQGEALLAKGPADRYHAEAGLRDAIEIARRLSAKSYELRATTSLARLLRETHRRDEARRMLAAIYGWFTEGFDTRDLLEARTLLDTLS